MRIMEFTSLTAAKDILDMLSLEFKIKPCIVKHHRCLDNKAYAKYQTRKIVFSMYSTTWKPEDMLIHEFAHILSFDRHGKKGRGHNNFFKLALIDVITAYYNDIEKYDWTLEYVSIKKWYSKMKGDFKHGIE